MALHGCSHLAYRLHGHCSFRGTAGPSRGTAGPSRGTAGPSRGPAGPSRGPAGPSRGPAGPSRGPAAHALTRAKSATERSAAQHTLCVRSTQFLRLFMTPHVQGRGVRSHNFFLCANFNFTLRAEGSAEDTCRTWDGQGVQDRSRWRGAADAEGDVAGGHAGVEAGDEPHLHRGQPRQQLHRQAGRAADVVQHTRGAAHAWCITRGSPVVQRRRVCCTTPSSAVHDVAQHARCTIP
jgi:hypothetical protein